MLQSAMRVKGKDSGHALATKRMWHTRKRK